MTSQANKWNVITLIAFFLLIISWIYFLANYWELPTKIPTHFDFQMKPDAVGNKRTMWFLPVISTILVAGLQLLKRIPHKFNYLVEITPENKENQFHLAIKLVSTLQVIIVLLFLFIIFHTFQVALKTGITFGMLVIPVILLVLLVTLIVYCIKSGKYA